MYCSKCGTKLNDGNKYCFQCGNSVESVDVHCEKGMQVNIDSNLMDAVELLKQGDEKAFETVYGKTYNYVFARAYYILGNREDALDLSQEVYLTVYKTINNLENTKSIYSWLRTITFRKGIKMIEKKHKGIAWSEEEAELFESIVDEHTKIEDTYVKEEDLKTIKKCIDMLSEEQRLVVLAYYFDNMKIDEIAKLLDISEGTVKSRLYLARKRLKAYLMEEEKEHGYKFYSVGLPTLLLAIGSALQEEVAHAESQTLYKAICSNLTNDMASSVVNRVSQNSSSANKTAEAIKRKNIGNAKGEIGKGIAKAGSKKIAISVASIALAGVVAGTVFLENDKGDKFKEPTTAQIEVEEFNKESFLDDIHDNIVCLDSCMIEMFGAEVDFDSGCYCALYASEDEAYKEENREIAKLVRNEDVGNYTEYYNDPACIAYYEVSNFKTNGDVKQYLEQYLGEDVISTWFDDNFLEYESELYLGRGDRGYGAMTIDMGSIKYVEERDGKHYVEIDILLFEEYLETQVLEFSKINDVWIITNQTSKEIYKSVLDEYLQAEANDFWKNNSDYTYVRDDLFSDYEGIWSWYGEKRVYYAKVDINEDDVEELFIAIKSDEIDNYEIVDMFLYDEEDENPKALFEDKAGPMTQRAYTLCEEGIIKTEDFASAGGTIETTFYQMMGNKLEIIDRLMEEYNFSLTNKIYSRIINGEKEEISEEEYYLSVNKYDILEDIEWTRLEKQEKEQTLEQWFPISVVVKNADGEIEQEGVFEYDTQGRIVKDIVGTFPMENGVLLGNDFTYEYLDDGNIKVVETYEDKFMGSTVYKLDEKGRVVWEQRTGTSGEPREAIEYEYENEHTLISVNSSAEVDEHGYITCTHPSSNKRYENEYDKNGNLIRKTIFLKARKEAVYSGVSGLGNVSVTTEDKPEKIIEIIEYKYVYCLPSEVSGNIEGFPMSGE